MASGIAKIIDKGTRLMRKYIAILMVAESAYPMLYSIIYLNYES